MILVSAVRLLRRFPALCVPALLAAVLQYKVVLLRPKIVYWMVAHWPRQHSVLVSEGNVGSRAFGNGFLYTEVSLGILMQVVQFAVWCAAFVLTGACLRQRPFGITVSWRRAGLWLQPHLGTVLLFSVAVYVVVVSTSALLGMMYTPASHVHGLGLLLWVATGLGVLVLCGASVFTLRLLPGGDRTVASDRWTTAGYKLLALCLSEALWNFASHGLRLETNSLAVGLLVTVLTALPYAVLFPCLALLVQHRQASQQMEGVPA